MTTVSAFWGDRVSSRQDAADVLSRTMRGVALVDPLLGGWRDTGRTKRSAMQATEIEPSVESLAPRLSVNRTDLTHEEIPTLGFSLELWNGQSRDDDQAGLTACLGLHAANPNLRNSCVVRLPAGWAGTDPRIEAVAHVMVRELEPDEVVAFDSDGAGGRVRRILWSRA